jgi:hypothetical protein
MAKASAQNAATIASDWVNGMGSAKAQANYAAGTANKGSACMQAAASAEGMANYQSGVQQCIANGSRVASLNDPMAASLYNANTGQAGAAKLGPGAQKKKAKYQAAITGLIPVWAQMAAAAAAVDPTGSRATAVQRAAAALQVLMDSGKKAAA